MLLNMAHTATINCYDAFNDEMLTMKTWTDVERRK